MKKLAIFAIAAALVGCDNNEYYVTPQLTDRAGAMCGTFGGLDVAHYTRYDNGGGFRVVAICKNKYRVEGVFP